MRWINRRQFLWLSAGACAPAGLGAAAWLRQGREHPAAGHNPSVERVSDRFFRARRTSWAMGSDVSITVLHADPQAAGRAVDAALAELERVESLMSLYRPDSQVCRLNRQGVLEDGHPHLLTVLRQAERISARTDGAFDVTVQPLWDLYAEAARSAARPTPSDVRQTLGVVDWRRVEVCGRRVRLYGPVAAITLNGIAQGFATDRVMAALYHCGIEHALVDAGEIGTLGDRADGGIWTAGIQHPRRPEAYLALAGLRGRCLATSGDYATRFSDDARDHHIFDPRTGQSPDGLASVSVVAPTAMLADALSTAVFVLGAEKGLDLIRSTPGADALLASKDGRTVATPGFPSV